MEDKKIVNDFLKQKIIESEKSMQDISYEIKVTYQTVKNISLGKNDSVKFHIVARLGKCLGFKLSDIERLLEEEKCY